MKSFFLGILGFVLSAVTFALIYPGYSDYITEAQMGKWCIELKDKVIEINNLAEKEGQLQGVSKIISPHQFNEIENVEMHRILNDGTILVQGGKRNQLMVLTPEISETEIKWYAFQAPSKLVTSNCRRLPNKALNEQPSAAGDAASGAR